MPALKIKADRVKELSTTVGTVPFVLSGADVSFCTFSSVMAIGDTCYYVALHKSSGEWETGIGTYSAINTLTRTTILTSNNTNSIVNFSIGDKYVFISAVASAIEDVAYGGTGASNAQEAMNTLAGGVTFSQYLRGTGTNVVMSAIQAGDVPTLNQNTTGTAATVTGATQAAITTAANLVSVGTLTSGTWNATTIAVANGGTGASNAQEAMNTLAGGVTFSQYLRGTGTNVVMSPILAADVPTLNQNTTGTAATVTGATQAAITTAANLVSVGTLTSGTWNATTIAVANGGTGVTTSTGTGNNVLSNSPTLVTPFSNSLSAVAVTSGLTASVTAATSASGTITYTCANTFTAGRAVSVTGLGVASGTTLNIAGMTIATASSTNFTVTNPTVGTSSGTGTATAGGNSFTSSASNAITAGPGGDYVITAGNGVGVGKGGNIVFRAGLQGTSGGDGSYIVRQQTGQTSNLQEWQDSAGNPKLTVDTNGAINLTPTSSSNNVNNVIFTHTNNYLYIQGGSNGVIIGGGGARNQQIILTTNFEVFLGGAYRFVVTNAGNVGIGINGTPINNLLSVTSPTTADSLATVLFAPTDTTKKGLVIQGKASQTANLTEWQNSAGTALAFVDASGNFNAITKSFNIPHPTKDGGRLRYASLEGPENSVYVRGGIKGVNEVIIYLPEYWPVLVHEDSLTVQLTAVGFAQPTLFVKEKSSSHIVLSADGPISADYMICAERRDVPKLEVES